MIKHSIKIYDVIVHANYELYNANCLSSIKALSPSALSAV